MAQHHHIAVEPVASGPLAGQQQLVLRGARVVPGTVLLREAPLAMSDALGRFRLPSAAYNDRQAWSLVERLLADVPRAAVRALLAPAVGYARGLGEREWEPADAGVACRLAAQHAGWTAAEVRALFDVVGTNNLTASLQLVSAPGLDALLQVPERLGFYPRLSRANHACAPTATIQYARDGSGALTLVATEDLAPGDAVTIDYLGPDNAPERGPEPVAAVRRAQLRASFGFECRCSACAV